MRGIVKAFRRPPTGHMDDRNGGLPRLSDSVAHASRCPASPRRTLLAENLGKPSLRVIIAAPWYERRRALGDTGGVAAMVSARDSRTTVDITIREARPDDAGAIAELFRLSSGGVADYIWNGLRDDTPGLDPVAIGARRYAGEDTAFTYRNCLIAAAGKRTAGMVHSYVMEGDGTPDPDMDPVLRPYAELEVPGSLYISGMAVYPDFRGLGIGGRLLDAVAGRARRLRCPSLSLIAFEENEGAVRLYLRRGFAVADRRKIVADEMIEYAGDALLMVRALD